MSAHLGHYIAWQNIFVDITSNITNVNLYNYVQPLISGSWSTSGKKMRLFVTVKSGVTIGSTSTSTPALNITSDVGFGGVGGFRAYDQIFLTLENNAFIEGAGGAGGLGGLGGPGSSGGNGGIALKTVRPVFLRNLGAIRGGGGGGAGGNGSTAVVATWGWACTKQGQNPNWGFNQTTAGQGCTTFNCCAGSCGGANAVGALGGCPGSGMSKLGTNTNFVCMTCGTYPINVTVNGCNGGRGQGYLQTVGAGGNCGGTSNAGGAGGTWGNNGDAQISAGVAGTGGRSIDGISNITAYNAANTGVLLGPTI